MTGRDGMLLSQHSSVNISALLREQPETTLCTKVFGRGHKEWFWGIRKGYVERARWWLIWLGWLCCVFCGWCV